MKKSRWIAETGLMLALLIALQWITKPLSQLVTGSCVNAILAVTVLVAGLNSGITVSLLSPLFAYMLGIAPQLVTVPAIMMGNIIYVVVLHLFVRKRNSSWNCVAGCILSAAAKFLVLYVLVNHIICGLASDILLKQGLLKAPMLEKLPGMFAWPQLFTALIGGAIAQLITPVIRKALHR